MAQIGPISPISPNFGRTRNKPIANCVVACCELRSSPGSPGVTFRDARRTTFKQLSGKLNDDNNVNNDDDQDNGRSRHDGDDDERDIDDEDAADDNDDDNKEAGITESSQRRQRRQRQTTVGMKRHGGHGRGPCG